jgi:hypothetical protein
MPPSPSSTVSTRAPGTAAAARSSTEESAIPWIPRGIAAGCLGAFVVALFFLAFDLLAGRPFWTPAALGGALFLGRAPGPDVPIEPILVLGYTAIHGTVFVALGLLAAFEVLSRSPRGGAARTAAVGAALFVGFELVFLALAALFVPGLVGILGAGRVALANLLAAGCMAAFLERRGRSVGP